MEEVVEKGLEIVKRFVGAREGKNPLRELQSEEIEAVLAKAPENREVQELFKDLGVEPSGHTRSAIMAVRWKDDAKHDLEFVYNSVKVSPAEFKMLKEHERQHVEDVLAGRSRKLVRYYAGDVRAVIRQIWALKRLAVRGALASADVAEALRKIERRARNPRTFADFVYVKLPIYIIGRLGRVPDPNEIHVEDVRDAFRKILREYVEKLAVEKDKEGFVRLMKMLTKEEPGTLGEEDTDLVNYIMELGRRTGVDEKELKEHLHPYKEVLRLLKMGRF